MSMQLPSPGNRLRAWRITLALLIYQTACITAHGASSEPAVLEPVHVQLRLKNFAQALDLLKPLANAQHPAAEYLLGTLYRSGLGIAANDPLARQWIEAAANHGDADAAYALAAMLAEQQPADDTAIQQWLQRAAAKGHELATEALRRGMQPQRFEAQQLQDLGARRSAYWRAAQDNDLKTLTALNSSELLNSGDAFGRTALAYAARSGAVQAAALLLQTGAAVDQPDAYNLTPLMLAASTGHTQVLQQLVTAGADLDHQDRVGNTALMYASHNGHAEVITLLLNKGANLRSSNAQGWSALDWAMHAEHTDISNQLRALGLVTARKASVAVSTPSIPLQHASTNDLYRGWPDVLVAASRSSADTFNAVTRAGSSEVARGPNGETPLLVAVQAGNTTVIEKLLSNSAYPTDVAETALSWAVRHEETALVQLMLSKGVKPDLHGQRENAPLIDAIHLHNEALALLLIKAGARPDQLDASGRSALILAAMHNQHGVISALINARVMLDSGDKQGRTALWHAAANGAVESLRILLEARANIDKRDVSNNTALMAAASRGQGTAVELLLNAGATTQAAGNGSPPLLLAAANGHEAIVKRLLSSGARVDAQNKFGDTALIVATRNGQGSVVRTLLAAGASVELRNADRASAKDVAEQLGLKELLALLTRGA